MPIMNCVVRFDVVAAAAVVFEIEAVWDPTTALSESRRETLIPSKPSFDSSVFGVIENVVLVEPEAIVTDPDSETISSAVANAENNFQYDIDNLIVKEAYCGKQIIMKRFRARAKGRAAPILKPYSNVTIILSEKNKMENHGTKS